MRFLFTFDLFWCFILQIWFCMCAIWSHWLHSINLCLFHIYIKVLFWFTVKSLGSFSAVNINVQISMSDFYILAPLLTWLRHPWCNIWQMTNAFSCCKPPTVRRRSCRAAPPPWLRRPWGPAGSVGRRWEREWPPSSGETARRRCAGRQWW